MLKKTLASLALATSLLACKDAPPQIIAMPATAEMMKPGQMTITGTAKLEVSPDCADLTMTISADGVRPGVATASLQAKQLLLVAALTKLGVEGADLKLSHLTLNPVYTYDRHGIEQPRVASYRATVTITATTRRFDQISALMDAGATAGVSSMSSQFRRSDLAELKKKVREMALTAAKDKAAQTAKALGIEIGRVVSVSEAPAGNMWGSPYFPQVANVAEASPSSSVTLGGELQSLTLDITIGYELAKSV